MKVKIPAGLLLFFLFVLSPLKAQEPGMIELVETESTLVQLFQRLYDPAYSSQQDSVNQEILRLFKYGLENQYAMDYPWSGLNMIGKLESEDKKLRIFTWNTENPVNDYQYYGFIQLRDGRKEGVFQLEDRISANIHNEMLKQTVGNWHGKLYYEILTNSYKKDSYYTLLGLDYNNAYSRVKTIEVLKIERGKPQFATGMFYDGRKSKDRVVLEYSSQVSISLRYNELMQKIVFDHLVPFQSIYYGDFRFYGPDGSYDAYRFSEGSWSLEEDVDARNY
ncbi:MAG: hypothetical protein ACOYXB_03665 [Bacteroidota bacterium]